LEFVKINYRLTVKNLFIDRLSNDLSVKKTAAARKVNFYKAAANGLIENKF